MDKPLPHPPYSSEYTLPKTKYGIEVRADQFVSVNFTQQLERLLSAYSNSATISSSGTAKMPKMTGRNGGSLNGRSTLR